MSPGAGGYRTVGVGVLCKYEYCLSLIIRIIDGLELWLSSALQSETLSHFSSDIPAAYVMKSNINHYYWFNFFSFLFFFFFLSFFFFS